MADSLPMSNILPVFRLPLSPRQAWERAAVLNGLCQPAKLRVLSQQSRNVIG